MHLMVELDGARIFLTGPQRRELRMAAIESADVGHKPGRLVFVPRRQIGVALGASTIARARQPHRSLVFYVAIGASRRERLLGMMDRTVVARQARLIGYGLLKTNGGNVARGALVSDQTVRASNWPGIVGLGTPAHPVPTQPSESGQRKDNRQNAAPTGNPAQRLEVVKIDALRELFGGACSSRHRPSVTQRHHSVHTAQHQ